MAQETVIAKPNPIKVFFQREDVTKKFRELLKDNSNSFITSVLTIVNASTQLKNASIESIYSAALKAAAFNLPISLELGFAFIIPYTNRKTGIVNANFQIGYKGLTQLALRTNQFKTISTSIVYEGQLKINNPLQGCEFNWDNKKSNKIIGYVSYFCLLSGFEKTFFWTEREVRTHAEKYSPSYKDKESRWNTDFDSMARKTVLIQILSKYAPLSIEVIHKAINEDDIFEGTDIEPIYDGIDHIDSSSDGIDKPEMDSEALPYEILHTLFKLKRQSLTPSEISRCKNILDNKIEDSYLELTTFLKSK